MYVRVCYRVPNMADTTSTVIDTEISYFNNISANWWTDLKALENQNKLRVPYIIKSLVETGKISREKAKNDKPLAGINILDVGCGGGFLSEERKDIQQNVKYIHGTVEKFCEQQKEQFDHVVAAEILDHIQARDLFVKSCVKTLKPGGTYFVSTINRTLRAWLQMILYHEYITGVIPKGTHHWHLFVTPDETRSWLENANCAILTCKGWCQIADGDWKVCDNTTIAYYMIAMKKYEH
ncbi:Coenzyme Q3 [Carabus blaptoides fortunei]